MGQFFETLPPSLLPWLLEQKVFYIASAPLSGDGHVNVSPKGVSDKGGPFFGVLKEFKNGRSSVGDGDDGDDDDEEKKATTANDKNVVIRQFWYMDLTGSGIETTSHLHEPGNGRITVMFNAFSGPPRILRIFGKGTPLEYGTPAFNDIVRSQNITIIPGTRSIILVDIHQVGTSCGFSMPCYDFVSFRPTLNDFFEKRAASERAGKREDGIERYWAYKNAWSMDGLPGLQRGVNTAVTDNVKPIKKMVGPYAPSSKSNGHSKGRSRALTPEHLILVAVLSSLTTAVLVLLMLRVVGNERIMLGRGIWR
ncbi:uncharacterized protein Z520_12145 [Fonsecaea multimorphosa CBS 102226]|uniref:Pyridoxamine 5'-phosphate oxidase putative domain-containing protein n=1 Tax=Fonsecaea multimorphosa CBS 102226 TaxID=1442371 RepID=A0A0D2JG69_9EURO|nr:uncharacterized protein Z520_12145 [Fonsecaea multimorphosa CBS 102226]KIX92152.1 hypothetical protein Z520_12145 [Fonsecaea multimorphosa CBS 102226]OAL17519.1 hypothetical protein AYO22_11554 [Fonsecaea multimorphosa]